LTHVGTGELKTGFLGMRASTDRAWNEFLRWCAGRRLSALPAHPWTVAAFARWCEPRRRSAAIADSIRAIARVHLRHCLTPPDRHPTVVRTLQAIEARQTVRQDASSLFSEKDFLYGGPASPQKPKKKRGASETPPARRGMSSRPPLVSRRKPGKGG